MKKLNLVVLAACLFGAPVAFADNGELSFTCFSRTTGYAISFCEDNVGQLAPGHHLTVDLLSRVKPTPAASYVVTQVSNANSHFAIEATKQQGDGQLPQVFNVEFLGGSIDQGVRFEFDQDGKAVRIEDATCDVRTVEAG